MSDQAASEVHLKQGLVAGLRLVEEPTSLVEAIPRSYVAEPRTMTLLAAHVSSLNAAANPDFVRVFNQADAAYADGISMSIVARAYGRTARKWATTDLAPALLANLATKLGRELRIVVIGAAPGVADEGAHALAGMTPVQVVMAEHGYHSDWEGVLTAARSHHPDVLILGLGMPKEAFWLEEHRAELPAAIVITCGGWLRLLADHEDRAPEIMRRFELEWLWRMVTDPGRTWKRYSLGTLRLGRHVALGLRIRARSR